jgi:glycosyltransferase involved in cell wall biosynthesis
MPCKISIITPSFNQALFLERTIRSVLDQGYPNLEYMILDGGSSDGSAAIIERYADRLTYWRSEADGGQADAIQRGFELASGDVLAYLNSDDVLLPGALHKVGQVFSNKPDCHLLLGNSLRIDTQDNVVRKVWTYPLNYHRVLFWGTGFDQPASFWRRQLYFEVGGLNTCLQFCFDYDLYLRMIQRAPVFRYDGFLAALRLHPGSKTSRLQDVRREESERIRRAYGYYDANAFHRWRYRVLNGLGFRLFQCYKLTLALAGARKSHA